MSKLEVWNLIFYLTEIRKINLLEKQNIKADYRFP